jgi:H+/Cl- antiporter ClcA
METSCKVTPRPKSVKEFFTTWYFWKPFLGIVIGLLAGFLYYYFVECKTIPREITSEAYSSVLFGGFLGFFITGSPCSRFGR